MPETPDTRCAIVAVIGAPNAGKSSLVNAMVGSKVSIVTHKVQTTRFPLRGVAMRGAAQLVLVDTPGVFAPRRRLDRAMVRAAWGSAADADRIVHLVDAPAFARGLSGGGDGADARANADVRAVVAGLKASSLRALLALNKVDAMPRERLLACAAALDGEGIYDGVLMISALTKDGVEDLAAKLATEAQPGPWLYPEDQAADAPARLLAAEITREKIMLRLHEEIPYEAGVETESWEERRDGSVRIEQVVYVAREGHRKIAIGRGAETIKAIGAAARAELEAELGRRVHLFLRVKADERWLDSRSRFAAWGLDFDA